MAASKKANAQASVAKSADNDGEKSEGPVVTLAYKRLRAARKKLNKIAETETAAQTGKELNADQAEQLRSKPGVVAVIEEIERLLPLLRDATKEENELTVKAVQAAADAKVEKIRAEAQAAAAKEAQAAIAAAKADAAAARKQAESAAAEAEAAKAQAEAAANRGISQEDVSVYVEKIIKLVYLSQLFDVYGYYSLNERQSCLTYDDVTQGKPLADSDLVNISTLGKMMTSRPQNKLVSHQEAMDACRDLALKYLFSQDHVVQDINVPVSTITERLQRVLASPYLTTQPTKVTVPEDKGLQEAQGLPPAMPGFPMGMEHASMPAMPSSVPGGITLDQLEQSFFRQQQGAQGAAAPGGPPASMASAAAPTASLPLGMVPPGGQMGGMPGAPPMQFPFYGQQPGFMPLGAAPGMPPPGQPGSHQQPGMPMAGMPFGADLPGFQGMHVAAGVPGGAAAPVPLPPAGPAAAAPAAPTSPQRPAAAAPVDAQPSMSSAANALPADVMPAMAGPQQQQQQPQGGRGGFGGQRGGFRGGRGGGGGSWAPRGPASAGPRPGPGPDKAGQPRVLEVSRNALQNNNGQNNSNRGGRGGRGGRGAGGLNVTAVPYQAVPSVM